MKLPTKLKIQTRYFNSFKDLGEEFEKTSTKKCKLREEYEFISNIPASLKIFYPNVHSFKEDTDRASYRIQKINAIDCSYMMIHPDAEMSQKIELLLERIRAYFGFAPRKEISSSAYAACIEREILKKNVERVLDLTRLKEWPELNAICNHYGYLGLDDYLKKLNLRIQSRFLIEKNSTVFFTHGDLCFSNILLYEDRLYLIDPKGADTYDNNYRPIHYELSKLSQSLLGRYDLINHESFDIVDNRLLFSFEKNISEDVLENFTLLVRSFGTDMDLIRLVESSLFLSLIPFHKESTKKMKGFLINSINIFQGI